MSRLVLLIFVICWGALVTVSGCSGCQHTAAKPDSASREKKPNGPTSPNKVPVDAAEEAAPLEVSQRESAPLDAPGSSSEAETQEKSGERRAFDREVASEVAATESNPPLKNSGKTVSSGATTPAEALNTGQAALRESAKLAAAGDDDAAFQTALDGWEATRRFPNHAQLKRLTAQLLQRLKQSGEATTRKAPPDVDKASVLE